MITTVITQYQLGQRNQLMQFPVDDRRDASQGPQHDLLQVQGRGLCGPGDSHQNTRIWGTGKNILRINSSPVIEPRD